MPTTIEQPDVIDEPGTLDLPGFHEIPDIRRGVEINGPWIVVLYNCDCHTFDDVIEILQKAIGCTVEVGFALALRVHTEGRAIVFSGSQEECARVTRIIASVRLQVEMDRA